MYKSFILLILSCSLFACSHFDVSFANQRSEVWTISADTVECYGVAPQPCMKVKKSPRADWQLFYDAIEGFDYQPGIEYKIRIAVTPVPNPPADASNQKYTLLDILETKKL